MKNSDPTFSRIPKACVSLKELLQAISEENLHPEVDSGNPVGRERHWKDDFGSILPADEKK